MATVGYMDGTDPAVLTKLALRGIGTFPLSNGYDMHGKYIAHLTKEDGIALVVGYVHKILPTPGIAITTHDLLYACITHNIPVVLIADKEDHEEAKKLLKEYGDKVRISDPKELYETIFWMLS